MAQNWRGAIVGWGHTAFGKHEELDVEELLGLAIEEALFEADVPPDQIDQIFVGQFNEGFSEQGFPASLVFQQQPELRFKPATRVENACATGTAALYQGLMAIEAGKADVVLVAGVEKMTGLDRDGIASTLLKAAYVREEGHIPGGFAGVFGQIAEAYFARFGDQTEALAKIAVKNHANGVDNPLAHFRKELDYEFCLRTGNSNPLLAGPLKRTDCSPVSDGAAALVLMRRDLAKGKKRAVGFRSAVQVNDFLPMSRRDVVRFEGASRAWKKALSEAELQLGDLSLVETHDCFTIAELMEYEAMGLAPEGQGARAIEEGWVFRDGKLPVNLSGGLKAKGHPVGATGVSMHIMAARQLSGEAVCHQLPRPRFAGVFNMGGAAVANCVSVLEAL
ncbi:acetyl-CoA acetyltransferase [Kiloniella sp. b19]|uniref:acetyl-CoA acetyltransferase n=1 Tax=Kiloniella sp. GXU_MW_B19 TaxID=3141326 RepID=UPI0031DA0E75